jgi:hypothetical protein
MAGSTAEVGGRQTSRWFYITVGGAGLGWSRMLSAVVLLFIIQLNNSPVLETSLAM